MERINKKYTVRFYIPNTLDFGYTYKGFCYLNKDNYHNQVINWINSGNTILFRSCTGKDYKYNSFNKSSISLNREFCSCIK
jgi:hypothetical protein